MFFQRQNRPLVMKNNTLSDSPNWSNQLPLIAICVDPKCLITFINHYGIAELKLDIEKVIGTSFFNMFDDTTPNQSAKMALLDRRPIKNCELITRIDEERAWFDASSAHFSVNGEINNETWLFLHNITHSKKQSALLSHLNAAATSLLTIKDTQTALDHISEFIVPSFADWFTVDILKDSKLELTLLKHKDADKIQWARQYRESYPPDPNDNSNAALVIKTGKPIFIPVLTEEMIDAGIPDAGQRDQVKQIGLYSVIMAPITSNGRSSGLVNFISSHADRHFDEQDLNFALNFANLIGISLENAQLHEQARNEIALRAEGEDRFRFLLDAIPHKTWTSAPDGRATYYNKKWYEYTGISDFKNLRENIWAIIHPDDLADASQRWEHAVKSGNDIEIEHRLQRNDQTYRWHLSRVSAIKNELSRVVMWVGTSTDIDALKNYELQLAGANAEMTASNEELSAANEELEAVLEEQSTANDELRQTQETLKNTIRDLENARNQFQAFLHTIPQIAWAGAPNGDVTYYNQRWYDYTGLSFEETKDQGWKQIIHPDDLAFNLERHKAIIDSQKPGEFEIREKHHSGDFRWHLVRMTPVFNSTGHLEQWIGTATDIDDIKKLEQQKDDFISIASHELKTPLTSLKTTIQLLYNMREHPSPDKFRKLIEQGNRSMHKIQALVDDLLNMNRFKDAALVPDMQWFILSELVNGCCNHITIGGQHELIILGDKTLKVYADERAIDQVVVNFVNNAVKYAPDSKQIEVSIEKQAEGVKLSVRDHGPGIKPEQLPLIFDRYYQGVKPNYRNPGLGLGLYICSEIIKKHGGTIGVESKPGNGSTFWFTLPEAKR
jgi:PAS domain S-box-containing protein